MSGGQHNPNGRQAQLGSAWNHLQLQAPYLGRVPQAAHMSSERAGVTWHTPTPPLHQYHAPAPSSPDPLQALKVGGASGNSVYRHTPTPPDRDTLLYRHTPTPPDKLYRHTPSPGDAKAGANLPPAEIYPIPLPRDKMRAEELLAYARGGVDLTLGRPPANGAPLSLSVRDAPTINSLITAATARAPHPPRPAHARVDALLERLAPAPHSPHSVIVHPRAVPSPSPPDSNEDSTDSCGAPPGAKRKRKPDRTVKVHASPAPPIAHTPTPPPRTHTPPPVDPSPPPLPPQDAISRVAPPVVSEPETGDKPLENGDGPHVPTDKPPSPGLPHARRKTKSDSAETIDDIAAMIASTNEADGSTKDRDILEPKPPETDDVPATIEVLKSVLGSPEPASDTRHILPTPLQPSLAETSQISNPNPKECHPVPDAHQTPKRRSTRSSRSDTSAVQDNSSSDVKTASEMKPAESTSKNKSDTKNEEPETPSFVEVENQLEKMFAGIEEAPAVEGEVNEGAAGAKKRRRSRVGCKAVRGKASRRSSGAVSTDDGTAPKGKVARKKSTASRGRKRDTQTKEAPHRDAYDSGSNASSGRSRGPYVQIRGPRDSPLSVSVVNAATGEDDCDGATARARPKRRKVSADGEFRNGLKSRGLHCSTLSLRYDATTPDSSWVCVFCELGPHAGVKERLEGPVRPLGDLFGPYTVSTACEEYRALDESRQRWHTANISDEKDTREIWFHEDCGLWAPGLVAAGARLSGLQEAVWGARWARCGRCGRAGAGVACAARACPARAHVNCARATLWQLDEEEFRALCPRHAHA